MISSPINNKSRSSFVWRRIRKRVIRFVFGTLLVAFVLSQSIHSSLQLDLSPLPSLSTYVSNTYNSMVNNSIEIPVEEVEGQVFDEEEEPVEDQLTEIPETNATRAHTRTTTKPATFLPAVTIKYENNQSTRITIRSVHFNETLASKDKKIVAICTAARSRPEWQHMSRAHVQTILIDSIRKTVSIDKELVKWSVRLYVAIDHDDSFWTQEHLSQLTLPSFLTIKLAIFPKNTANRIPFNEITKLAYDEGAEYLCRVNDDTEFISKNWITRAVKVMETQFDPPNVGVVGPLCRQGNSAILTHDFVHRTHLDIFQGVYYPKEFKNWYLDNWITNIYSHGNMGHDFHRIVVMQDWEVKHHLSTTRYKVDAKSLQSLHGLLQTGRKQIKDYLQEHHATHSDLIPDGFPLPKQRIGQEQFDAIASVFPQNGRILSWGVGFDGAFWYDFANKRVVFVVDHKIRDKFWHAYQYLDIEWTAFIDSDEEAVRNHCGLTFAKSLRNRIKGGELFDVILIDPSPDNILIDSSPENDCELESSLLLAKMVASKQICERNRTTHVFVDDYEQERVRNATLKFFDRKAISVTTRNNAIVQGYFHFDICDVVEVVANVSNTTNSNN